MSWRLATRDQWGFTGPSGPAMTLPSRGLFLHHTVTTPTADPYADMRLLERIGKSKSWKRLSYSWAYHVTRRIFLEGQANHIGAHTANNNSTSHGLALIGDYHTNPLPNYVAGDIAGFIRHGTKQGWWPSVLVGGHRDVSQTVCPGRHGYDLIPHIHRLLTGSTTQEDDMVKQGDRGGHVQWWQQRLNQWHAWLTDQGVASGGTPLVEDGVYGTGTATRVGNLQRLVGFPDTGDLYAAFQTRIIHDLGGRAT